MSGIIAAIWFLLPAGAANVAPVVAARLFPRWNLPVDFGCTVGGARLFGAHKTWRGLTAGILTAAIVFRAQQWILDAVPEVQAYALFSYAAYPAAFGALMGAAALAGDLIKSTIKRQLHIAPGRSWFPFDQIDWLFGTIVITFPVLDLRVSSAADLLLAGIALHLIAHYVGYRVGMNSTPI